MAVRTDPSPVVGLLQDRRRFRSGGRHDLGCFCAGGLASLLPPPAIAAKLRKLGLHRRDDLVLHLPIRYEDETQLTPIATAPGGVPVQVEAEVIDVSVQYRPRRQLVVTVADASGELILRFLNFYGSQTKQLERARDEGRRLRLFGEIRQGFFGAEMVHPRYRLIGTDEALAQSLTPVYPTTAGVS